jgi:hypothetical protein
MALSRSSRTCTPSNRDTGKFVAISGAEMVGASGSVFSDFVGRDVLHLGFEWMFLVLEKTAAKGRGAAAGWWFHILIATWLVRMIKPIDKYRNIMIYIRVLQIHTLLHNYMILYVVIHEQSTLVFLSMDGSTIYNHFSFNFPLYVENAAHLGFAVLGRWCLYPLDNNNNNNHNQCLPFVGVFEAYLCCKKLFILRVYISEFHSISATYLVCGQTLCLINGLSQVIRSTNLVGGLEHFLFFHILGIIIPTD